MLALAGCLKVPPITDEPGTEQGAPRTAKEVLDRYIVALGGEAALRKVQQRTEHARVVILPQTGCTGADENCLRDESCTAPW